jgi:hypothetical protein
MNNNKGERSKQCKKADRFTFLQTGFLFSLLKFLIMHRTNCFLRKNLLIPFLTLLIIVSGCKDDDPKPIISAENFEITIDEHPASGAELGSLNVTTNRGALAYSLKSESVAGAFAINATTGMLTVLDGSKFDFETNPFLTAIILVKNINVETNVDVKVNLQKIIWEGPNITFTKAHNADWTLAANQDRITDKVYFTRQSKAPIYNYKWWQDNFGGDATYNDLVDDFWNEDTSPRAFVRAGGTKGVRWALLDKTGSSTETWDDFELYGTLGDPTHFYSFHNVASIIMYLEDGVNVSGVHGDFGLIFPNGDIVEGTGTYMDLFVGKKLGVWLVEEDIYFTLTFTHWGSGGSDNGISYTRSSKD